MTQRAALRVNPNAATLRRDLGPSAWTVLEELAAIAHDTDDRTTVADVAVRQLADVLGLARGTIGRALRTLRAAGLVAPTQRRRGDGVFARGSYTLHVPASALTRTESAVPIPRPASVRRPVPVRSEQLALLPE